MDTISVDSTAEEVQEALEALPTVPGGIAVTREVRHTSTISSARCDSRLEAENCCCPQIFWVLILCW